MGKTIVETRLLALGNDVLYLLVSLPQEIQNLIYKFSLVLSQLEFWYKIFVCALFRVLVHVCTTKKYVLRDAF